MKTLFKIIAGLAVVVIIAVVLVVTNLGSGIKSIVEELGPDFVKADVKLNEVDLSLTTGEGSLKGLSIGNPAGFKTANAFSLGEIALAVEPESIASDVIVVNSIKIIAPEITYENGKNGSNIDQLQKNVEQAVNELTGGSSGDDTATDDSSSKKLIIKDLLVSGGQISYSNPLLGDKTVDVELPRIHLTGIGEKSGGATAVEVVDVLLSSLNKESINAIAREGLLEDAAKDAIQQGKDKLEKTLGGFKGLLKKE